MIRYTDFLLNIVAIGNQYRVLASLPDGRSGRATFELDDTMMDVATHKVLKEENGKNGEQQPSGATRGERPLKIRQNVFNPFKGPFGTSLYKKLFEGEIIELFTECFSTLKEEEGVRITLKFDLEEKTSEYLFSLPWELLKKEKFYNLSTKTPIVRHVEVTSRSPNSLEFGDTIRVLILAANPEGTDQLNLDVEIDNMLKTLVSKTADSSKKFTYKLISNAQKKDLKNYLKDEKVFDIIHFLGHGIYDADRNEGALIFEDENKQPDLCYTGNIENWAADNDVLKLFFLNACETALTGKSGDALKEDDEPHEPYSGVAPTLVKAGVPAVLAMQRPITDRAAITFSKFFYEKLVEFHTGDAELSLEACVTEARNEVQDQNTEPPEWATPVLFLRTPAQKVDSEEKSRRNPPAILKERKIYLYYHEDDLKDGNGTEMIKPLKDKLKEYGVDILEPRFSIPEEHVPKDRLRKLSKCHGYIQVLGTGDYDWEMDFVDAVDESSMNYLAEYTCFLPPSNVDKENRLDDDNVINCMNKDYSPDDAVIELLMQQLSKDV